MYVYVYIYMYIRNITLLSSSPLIIRNNTCSINYAERAHAGIVINHSIIKHKNAHAINVWYINSLTVYFINILQQN